VSGEQLAIREKKIFNKKIAKSNRNKSGMVREESDMGLSGRRRNGHRNGEYRYIIAQMFYSTRGLWIF